MRLINADIFNNFDYSSFDGALTEDATQGMETVLTAIDRAPTIDAVPMVHLEKWLYEIAINNTDNYLADACEEIISRLDGLKRFSKETKIDEVSEKAVTNE